MWCFLKKHCAAICFGLLVLAIWLPMLLSLWTKGTLSSVSLGVSETFFKVWFLSSLFFTSFGALGGVWKFQNWVDGLGKAKKV
jgi:hypothetical protein